MKKTTLIIVALVVVLCCAFSMAACNEGEHTHEYDSAWTNDSTYHWHECKGEGECGAKQKDKAAHIDEDENGKCDVCDYDMNGVVTVGKEQYAKVLNAFVNYFEPRQQATPQAVARRRDSSSRILSEDITLDDILTYTLDTSTDEGAHTLVLPLTYSYLLACLCDNDNFVVGDNPVQFVATIESRTMTFVCDFNYDTTADKLTLDLQVTDAVASGVASLLHCEIAYYEDADTVGDFLIHGVRIGGSGFNGSIESYTYLTIRNNEGALKMCESSYFVADGRMEMQNVDEFAAEYGEYHVGLLDDLMDDFNDRAQNKDVLQNNFANEFMQAGQYINELIGRLINGGGSVGGGDVAVESITLDSAMLEVDIYGYVNLNVQFNPSTATDKTVVWQSSDEEVATVQNGKVHALSAGEATITATTSNGKSATCLIKVIDTIHDTVTDEEWQTAFSKDSFVNFVARMNLTGEDGAFYIRADLDNFKYYYNNNQGEEYYMSKENDVYYEYKSVITSKTFTRTTSDQGQFERQLWNMEALTVLALIDSYSQFTYDADNNVYVGKGVLLLGANYDINVGFRSGKLYVFNIDLGEGVYMDVVYTYGNAVVNLPEKFDDGGSSGDVKPQPQPLVGGTYVAYDVTANGASDEVLASLREQVIGNITVVFDSESTVRLIDTTMQYEMIKIGSYVVEGSTITVTIVSATLYGNDFTSDVSNAVAGTTSEFTIDGDILTMQVDGSDFVATYYFRLVIEV